MLILKLDVEMASREEAEERAKLEAIKKGMSAEEIQAVMAGTKELQRLQEAPDSPEALAAIPTLKLTDLDRKNKTIPSSRMEIHGAKVLYHDLFTSGIAYLEIGHDLHHLPQEWLPYVRLFSRALTEIGTDTQDYVQLTRRISGKTGGIRPEIFTSSVHGQETASARLFLRSKCMMHQVRDMFSILRDMLLTVRLDNQERFRQMVLEEKARTEHQVVPNGHQVVNARLRAHFSEADWASEQMSGASYLFFIRQLAQDVDQRWSEVLAVLEGIRRILVNRRVMIFNVTLDGSNWDQFRPTLGDFIGAMPVAESGPVQWSPALPAPFEGMTIPAQVNYVGKGCNLYSLGYAPHGSAQVISGYLRTSWLWEKIRVQGGAYGAFCLFDRISGMFSYLSYRDPNLQKTLENFDLASRFLKDNPLSPEELTKGIIGAIGNLDAYQLPDAKGYLSLLRHLIGDTDAMRQQIREEVLGTTTDDFRAFADILEKLNTAGIVKVLGSDSALQGLDSRKFQVIRLV